MWTYLFFKVTFSFLQWWVKTPACLKMCDRRLSCFLFHDWQLEVKTPKPELKQEQRTLNQMCGYEKLLCDTSPTLSAELLLRLWFISFETDVVLRQVILGHQLIFPDLFPAGVHFLGAKICLFFSHLIPNCGIKYWKKKCTKPFLELVYFEQSLSI